uniref:Uncharacterized protein n=1 Tax=Lepeophtheirus salmonis TaxID=72036 RepID=A0A0K2TVW4_LEPSM
MIVIIIRVRVGGGGVFNRGGGAFQPPCPLFFSFCFLPPIVQLPTNPRIIEKNNNEKQT